MQDEMCKEHEQYFRSVFQEFDQNGDNIMDKEELRLLMAALGQNLNESMVDQLLYQIDTDRNGTIDCEQFIQLMHMYFKLKQRLMKKAEPKYQFSKTFEIFDRDGNGTISASELRQVMINLDQNLTNSEVQEIYRRVNVDGNGQMGQQQFIKVLMLPQFQ